MSTLINPIGNKYITREPISGRIQVMPTSELKPGMLVQYLSPEPMQKRFYGGVMLIEETFSKKHFRWAVDRPINIDLSTIDTPWSITEMNYMHYFVIPTKYWLERIHLYSEARLLLPRPLSNG